MFALRFEPISLARQEDYLNLLAVCPQKASDYSFVNLWAWAYEYCLEWAWEEGLVWIRQSKPELCYWAPVGNWKCVDWQRSLGNLTSGHRIFIRVPEMLVQCWEQSAGNGMIVEENRGHWDYLYEAVSLRELAGNRYHKKKNLVKQFNTHYAHEYLTLDQFSIDAARAMQNTWCDWRDCESNEILASENRAIERVFSVWENLKNIAGGALLVEGEMAAYTVSERLTQDTLLIHFEKGKPEIKGIYQAINHSFVSTQKDIAIVNREQDLDDEGLRKAKLSYHPFDFIKKYRVFWS